MDEGDDGWNDQQRVGTMPAAACGHGAGSSSARPADAATKVTEQGARQASCTKKFTSKVAPEPLAVEGDPGDGWDCAYEPHDEKWRSYESAACELPLLSRWARFHRCHACAYPCMTGAGKLKNCLQPAATSSGRASALRGGGGLRSWVVVGAACQARPAAPLAACRVLPATFFRFRWMALWPLHKRAALPLVGRTAWTWGELLVALTAAAAGISWAWIELGATSKGALQRRCTHRGHHEPLHAAGVLHACCTYDGRALSSM